MVSIDTLSVKGNVSFERQDGYDCFDFPFSKS
jgi:hypothetical protein